MTSMVGMKRKIETNRMNNEMKEIRKKRGLKGKGERIRKERNA